MAEEEKLFISKDFLRSLLNQPSPSGFEGPAVVVWREYAEKFADKVFTDYHGNTFAVINPEAPVRVMLAGHIDEIGLMVTQIASDGSLKVGAIGGHDPQVLVGQRVYVLSSKTEKPILGVIGRKPIHVLRPDEKEKAVKIEDLWVDIGLNSKEEVQKLVEIGDPIVIAYSYDELNASGGKVIVGRGIDDRIGAFTVLEALRLAKELGVKHAVYAVATVQEEIGIRGAKTSAYRIDPHVGIAVDVTFASDIGGLKELEKKIGEVKLGKGPVIARGPNLNPKLVELFKRVASEEDIPYQLEAAPRATGTDANAIQLTRSGPITGLISIPNRYMHSPCELVNLEDVDNAVKLIAKTITRIDKLEEFVPF